MKYYPAMDRSKPLAHEHTYESQKHHAKWKKTDMKEDMLYNYIYMKG